VAESDDVGVSLWCKINSGKVKIFFPDASPDLEAEAKADLRIVIASKEYVFSGTTSANDVSGVTSIEMELPVDDPVIVAMQEADRFAAIIAGHTTTYPLIEAGVENLIRLCKAK
jgi:hypothetical protein